MITRDRVISNALLLVGETQAYNSNQGSRYELASFLLDELIDMTASDVDFLFNSSLVKLNKANIQENDFGEKHYLMPIDLLNIINMPRNARRQGEYILSKNEEVYIQYCRKIDLNECKSTVSVNGMRC